MIYYFDSYVHTRKIVPDLKVLLSEKEMLTTEAAVSKKLKTQLLEAVMLTLSYKRK